MAGKRKLTMKRRTRVAARAKRPTTAKSVGARIKALGVRYDRCCELDRGVLIPLPIKQ